MKRKSFSVLRSTLKRSVFLLVAAIALVLVWVNIAHANGAQVQVKNENTFDANSIKFKRVEYVGQCPGTVFSPGTLKGRFVSSSTSPAAKRRVIIRNVTEGMNSDPYPYTNRSYEQGQYSEGFDFSFGDKHRTRTFSVIEGENKFDYEIKESDKVVEQGTFTAEVSIKDLGVFPREAICEDKLTCREQEYWEDDGKGGRRRRTRQRCYTTNQCRCP